MVQLAAFVKHIFHYLLFIDSMVLLYDNDTNETVLQTILDASTNSSSCQLVNVDVIKSHPDFDTPFFFVDIAAHRHVLIVAMVSNSFFAHQQFIWNEIVDYFAYAYLILAHCESTIEADLRPLFQTSASLIVAIIDRTSNVVYNVTTGIPAQWQRPSFSSLSTTIKSNNKTRFQTTALQRLRDQTFTRTYVQIHMSFSMCANVHNISVEGPRSGQFMQLFHQFIVGDVLFAAYSYLADLANTSQSPDIGNCWPLSVRQPSGRIARSVISHPTWGVNGFILAVPNWWHLQSAATDGPRMAAARIALIFNGLLTLGIFLARWLLAMRRRRSTVARISVDLFFDTVGRVFAVSVPDKLTPDGLQSQLGLMVSIWGLMMCGFVSSVLFDMALMDPKWQPVFLTPTDVWAHPWLPIVSGGILQTGESHVRNSTGRTIYSADMDGREVRIYSTDETINLIDPIWEMRHKNNGSLIYRKISHKNCTYFIFMKLFGDPLNMIKYVFLCSLVCPSNSVHTAVHAPTDSPILALSL